MARMHTRCRDSFSSDKPVADEVPEWSDVSAANIEARVVELVEQGKDPSQIGLSLRDESVKGVPVSDVKLATGRKVTTILEEDDAAGDLSEDLRNLTECVIRLREHMEGNQQDKSNRRALQNTESKIRRPVSCYRDDKFDDDLAYSYDVAAELLEG